jgi:hypothetical protein
VLEAIVLAEEEPPVCPAAIVPLANRISAAAQVLVDFLADNPWKGTEGIRRQDLSPNMQELVSGEPSWRQHQRIVAQQERLARMARERDLRADPRAVAIFEKFCEIDAGFRISFPDNLAASLTQVLMNLTPLQRSANCRAYAEFVGTIIEVYREALQLRQTHVEEFQLMGGGFGIVGAAEGIMIAQAANFVSRMFTNSRLDELSKQMNELVSEASTQIAALQQIMG